jgi:hypothetical protein
VSGPASGGASSGKALDYFVDERITSREMAADWLRRAMACQESEVAHV